MFFFPLWNTVQLQLSIFLCVSHMFLLLLLTNNKIIHTVAPSLSQSSHATQLLTVKEQLQPIANKTQVC